MAEKKAAPKRAPKEKTSEETPKAAAGAKASAKQAKAHAPVAQKAQNRYSKAAPRRTWVPSPTDMKPRWFVVDATDLVLGRAASRIASILRGKHLPTYTPHADMGDYIIIVNAEKVKLTGAKEEDKPYYHHSMYPGGLKTFKARDVRVRNPERLFEDAIRRMISRNPLGRETMRKLFVYKGPNHPHHAQKPEPLALA